MAHVPMSQRSAWQQAEKVRASHADAAERLRSRKDLSIAGRRRQLAKLAVTARDRLAQIRADDEQQLAERSERLQRELFRPMNSTPEGQRHALECAERAARCTTPAELERLASVAHDLGSPILAQAVARRGVDLANADPAQCDAYWGCVYAWSDTVPFGRESLIELGQIDAEALDAMHLFAASQHYRPDVVPELAGVGNIDSLANAADDTADLLPVSAQQEAWDRFARGVHSD